MVLREQKVQSKSETAPYQEVLLAVDLPVDIVERFPSQPPAWKERSWLNFMSEYSLASLQRHNYEGILLMYIHFEFLKYGLNYSTHFKANRHDAIQNATKRNILGKEFHCLNTTMLTLCTRKGRRHLKDNLESYT